MIKVSERNKKIILFTMIVIVLLIAFVSFQKYDFIAFANETAFTNGALSTEKLGNNFTPGVVPSILSGANMKLEGEELKSSNDANPLDLFKSLFVSSNVNFADPQLQSAIKQRRLRVDIEISGTNRIEVLENGVWIQNFDIASILDYEIISNFIVPAHNITSDISQLKGDFSNYKVVSDLLLNEGLLQAYSMRLDIESSVTMKKEPSSPGRHETGIRIFTNITAMQFKLKFEKLKIEVDVVGVEAGAGRILFQNEDHQANTGETLAFDVDFIFALRDPDNFENITNKPVFEAKETSLAGKEFLFVGWSSISGHVGGGFYKQKYLTANFLEDVPTGVTVRYRATFRSVTFLNDQESILYKSINPLLPALYIPSGDTSSTSFEVGLQEKYTDLISDEEYNNVKPTKVSDYRYDVTVTLGKPDIGGEFPERQISIRLHKVFSIIKANPVISLSIPQDVGEDLVLTPTNSAELYFGQPLSYLSMKRTATHDGALLQNGTFSFVDIGNNSGEVVPENEVFTRSGNIDIKVATLGQNRQYVKYVPFDTHNYNTVYEYFNLNVSDGMNIDIRNEHSTRTSLFSFSYTDEIDTSVNNNLASGATLESKVLKLSFDVNFSDTSGNYFFLGLSQLEYLGSIRKFFRNSGGNNNRFDYYFKNPKNEEPVDINKEIRGSFAVNFVRDITAYNGIEEPADYNRYVINYTGNQASLSIKFSDDDIMGEFITTRSLNFYLNKDLSNPLSILPIQVGTHEARYEIILALSPNPADQFKVGDRVLEIRVDRAKIVSRQVSQVGKSIETGFSQSETVSLTSTNVRTSSVTRYYYSDDNKQTFNEINFPPENSLGCPAEFIPYIAVNSSRVKNYYFIGVNNQHGESQTYGSSTYKVVSESQIVYESKLDNQQANNISITPAGTNQWGTWIKNDFEFRISLNHGLSGFRLFYKEGHESTLYKEATTSLMGVNYSGLNTYNVFIRAASNSFLDNNLFFRVTSGTNVSEDVSGSYNVKIDKYVPTLTLSGNIANKWYKNDVEVIFRWNDQGSGVLDASDVNITGSGYDVNSIVISSNTVKFNTTGEGRDKNYTVFIKDKAGNESQNVNFTVRVDKTDLNSKISKDNFEGYYYDDANDKKVYIPGVDAANKNWINKNLSFTFEVVEAGASKLKIQYRKGGEATWRDVMSSFEGVEVAPDFKISLYKDFPIAVSSEGESALYRFRVLNEVYQDVADKTGTFVEFDYGRIDIDKTPLQLLLPQDMDVWVNAPVVKDLGVRENEQEIYKSGVLGVWYDFGRMPDIEDSSTPKAVLNTNGTGYEVTITSSLPIFFKAIDNAGNIAEVDTTDRINCYKVDPVLFTDDNFEYAAYKDGGNISNPDDQSVVASTLYNFGDREWSNQHVRLVFKFNNIPASGIYIYETSIGSAVEKMIASIYPANESEIGAVDANFNQDIYENQGKRVVSAYYVDQMRISTGFVIKTGAGYEKIIYPKGTAHINIDKVTPTIVERSKTSGGFSFDFTANWTYKDSKMTIAIIDDMSQIQSVYLLKKAIDASIYEDVTETELKPHDTDASLRVIDFDGHFDYKIEVRDNADNVTEREFTSLIDKFDDVEISSIGHTIYDIDATSHSNYELRWLETNEAMSFKLIYAYINGATKAGPSGLYVDFMRQGENEFDRFIIRDGVEQRFNHDATNKTFEMLVSSNQVEKYTRLRLTTGAGVAFEQNINIEIKKDNKIATFDVNANIVGESISYSGLWTSKNIDVKLNLSSGPSAKNIYYAMADSFSDITETEWIELGRVSSDSQIFTHRISDTFYGKVFFKLSSEQGEGKSSYFETGYEIKIDKGAILPQISAKTLQDDDYLSGHWSDKVIVLHFAKTGESISPISSIQIIEDLVPMPFEHGIDGTYQINLPAEGLARQKVFKLRITNEAGNTEDSAVFNVWQSLITPSFTYSVGPEFENQSPQEGWYLTRVAISFSVETSGIPEFYGGYKYYIRKKLPSDSEYGDWEIRNLTARKLYIADENASSVKGGSDYLYSIKVVAPNGRELIKEDEPQLHIKIDQANYVAKITQYVGDREGSDYSVVTNNGFVAKRGARLPFISVNPNNGYYYKSISYSDGTNVMDENYSKSAKERGLKELGKTGTYVTFQITNQDVNVVIKYYRDLSITIINAERHIQGGSNLLETKIHTTDSEFITVFGPIKLEDEEYEGKCVRIKLKYFDLNDEPIDSLPTEIGSYFVSFEESNALESDFIIEDNKRAIKVNYFAGKGTYSSPYLINNIYDYFAMGIYMKYDPNYEAADPYNFLNPEGGAIRYYSYFRQTADLVFPIGLFPEAGKFPNADASALVPDGSNASFAFKGVYDGDGYELKYQGVLLAEEEQASGGFFSELLGAKIRNIRVNLDVNINSGNLNYGLIAAKATNSMVLYSYAIGNISVNNMSEASVGGLIGYADNTLVGNCVADVIINKVSGTGIVGGIIGRSKDSYMVNTYFIGTIIVEEIENIAQEGADTIDNYIGALIGFQEFNPQSIIKIRNFIRVFSVSVNGQIQSGLSTGNDYTLSTEKRLDFNEKQIADLMNDNTQIIRSLSSQRSRSVRELVLYRVNEVKESLVVSGDGTSLSPIIIDSAEKLAIISLVPWAYYKQVSDINIDLYELSEKGGDYASVLTSGSFVGDYDGGNYSLNISGEFHSKSKYLGLFNILGGSLKNLTIKGLNLFATNQNSVIVGGIAGLMLEGAKISNVHVGGSITVVKTGDAYVGSVAAISSDNASIEGVVSAISIKVLESNRVLAGGLVGRAEGSTKMKSIVFTSSLHINSKVIAKAGRFLGHGSSGAIVTNAIRLIRDGFYLNGIQKKNNAKTLYYESTIEEYEALTETERSSVASSQTRFVIGTYTMELSKHLARVSQFAPNQGVGTPDNPYIIRNYKDLLLISNNMHAHFLLANDIVIGDYDGDGIVDDSYKNDFKSLGGTTPFKGHLEGNQRRITNLSAPLFNVNAGSIFNLQLDINYNLKTDNEYTIVFGVVTRENLKTGYIIGVTVSGSIDIVAPNANILIGAIAGKSHGLEIKANTVNIETFSVSSFELIMGGIIGLSTENRVSLLLAARNQFVTVSSAIANGAHVYAGHTIGYLEANLTAPPQPSHETASRLYKNGQLLDGRLYQIGNHKAELPSSP